MKDLAPRRIYVSQLEAESFPGTQLDLDSRPLQCITRLDTVFKCSYEDPDFISRDTVVKAAHVVGYGDCIATTGCGLKIIDLSTGDFLAHLKESYHVRKNGITRINHTTIAVLHYKMQGQDYQNFLMTVDVYNFTVKSDLEIKKSRRCMEAVASLSSNVIIAGDNTGALFAFNHNDGNNLKLLGVARGYHKARVKAMAAHNECFAVSDAECMITTWNTAERIQLTPVPMKQEGNIEMNDRFLVCAGRGSLRVYERIAPFPNATDGASLRLKTYISREFHYFCDYWCVMKLLPNNLLIVAGPQHGVMVVLNLKNNAIIARYRTPGMVCKLEISQEGHLVASLTTEEEFHMLGAHGPQEVVEGLHLYCKNIDGFFPLNVHENPLLNRK